MILVHTNENNIQEKLKIMLINFLGILENDSIYLHNSIPREVLNTVKSNGWAKCPSLSLITGHGLWLPFEQPRFKI
jgi:hypothetical protein